jgi:small-conductance mechanosensitive channel
VFGFDLSKLLSVEKIETLLRVAFLLFIGIPVVYVVSRTVRKYVTRQLSAQKGMIVGKVLFYGGLFLVVFSVLKELNFELTPILATAGVAGIAIGFASQTSISNVISGFFLIAEQPFSVGDVITAGSTTGEVLSIDTLSVKIRTFDNRFVRIPNETIIKSEVMNNTYFPIRRVDLNLGVAYKEDISRVREVLLDIAYHNPVCLQEPEPIIIFSGFGNSSIDLFFGVWAERPDFLKLKNSIQEEIKKRFDEEGIEIPFPHVSVYAGSVTQPFPVQINNQKQTKSK